MEKILIDENRLSYTGWHNKKSNKIKYWNDALDYCSQLVEITNKAEFEKSFIDYLEKQLRIKSNGMCDQMTRERLFQFYDVSESTLRTIQSKYLDIQFKHIKWNDDYTDCALPDFSSYVETPEELERYKACIDLIKAFKRIGELGYTINSYELQRAVSGAVLAMGSKQAKPNTQFIKQGRR